MELTARTARDPGGPILSAKAERGGFHRINHGRPASQQEPIDI